MLLAGLGIPVMAALNGVLGSRLNSPALAATILFSVGLVVAVVYLILTEGLPSKLYVENTPWYFYSGGFFVMFYILSITWVAPRFGISNAIAFALLGQLIAMSLIDHFGLIGVPIYTLTIRRVFGLALMTIGVFLVLNKK
jgi:transporter family-2 protein